MCFTKAGLGGVSCNEICPNGLTRIAVNTITILTGLMGATWCVYCVMCNIYQGHSREKFFTPVWLTMIFAGTGMFLFGISSIVADVNSFGFRTFAVIIIENGRQLRRSAQPLQNAAYILYGISACAGVCALFILPIAWVSKHLLLFI
jgi:hypothetical protein